jgi:hypothetical protein
MRHRILNFCGAYRPNAPQIVMRHRNFYICVIEHFYINFKKRVSKTEILLLKNGGGTTDTETESAAYY